METDFFHGAAGIRTAQGVARVWLVRHGQRADDAGVPSPGLGLPPLSSTGFHEADAFAASVHEAPDLIVTSPFLRARQTARPLCQRYPAVPVACWPVEEFTPLAAAAFDGSTCAQRWPAIEAFWERNDPDFHPGPGGESFSGFIARIDQFSERLRQNPALFTIVFTHGYTIQAFRWRLDHAGPLSPSLMADFRAFRDRTPIPTVMVHPFRISHDGFSFPPADGDSVADHGLSAGIIPEDPFRPAIPTSIHTPIAGI